MRYHRGMAKPTHEDSDSDSSAATQSAPPTLWRWLTLVALLIAVVATAIAVVALVRPPQQAAGTEKSPEEAKMIVCGAFDTVRKAIALRTNVDLGPEPVAAEAVAANARLAMVAGGSYLLAQLDPATPSPLADEVRSFAENLQSIAIHILAGTPNEDPAQSDRLREGEESNREIAQLCK
jgi:hypothetical protein